MHDTPDTDPGWHRLTADEASAPVRQRVPVRHWYERAVPVVPPEPCPRCRSRAVGSTRLMRGVSALMFLVAVCLTIVGLWLILS